MAYLSYPIHVATHHNIRRYFCGRDTHCFRFFGLFGDNNACLHRSSQRGSFPCMKGGEGMVSGGRINNVSNVHGMMEGMCERIRETMMCLSFKMCQKKTRKGVTTYVRSFLVEHGFVGLAVVVGRFGSTGRRRGRGVAGVGMGTEAIGLGRVESEGSCGVYPP